MVMVEEDEPALSLPVASMGYVDQTSTRTAPLLRSLGALPKEYEKVWYCPMDPSVVMMGEVACRSQFPSPV